MSRSYSMRVEIEGLDPKRRRAIKSAANREWRFAGHWYEDDDALEAASEGFLCGGEGEDQFVDRLSMAVWRANGTYCPVRVTASYLDSAPYEEYELDEAAYQRLMAAAPEQTVAETGPAPAAGSESAAS